MLFYCLSKSSKYASYGKIAFGILSEIKPSYILVYLLSKMIYSHVPLYNIMPYLYA